MAEIGTSDCGDKETKEKRRKGRVETDKIHSHPGKPGKKPNPSSTVPTAKSVLFQEPETWSVGW